MAEHRFETHLPVDLYIEIGKGRVAVSCTDTTESTVRVDGRDADQVVVEQDGDQISVVAPRQRGGFFGSDASLQVHVVVPTSSNVATKTGSADVSIEGVAGSATIRSGSGDVAVDALGAASVVETGSGDIKVDDAHAELKVKSGSGDVRVGHIGGMLAISTGSGDVEIGTSVGAAVVKTGSGDLRVGEAHSDVAMSTGSGDFVVDHARAGRLTAKGASGDVRVGIPAGVPVWTDISTVSGTIHSSLSSAGQPDEGQDHIELRAKTVSGDIVLTQI
jgi:DUF4097 and DUF4098 domain-containing protein YvlB